MFRNIFLSLALIFSVAVFADGHTGAEKTVLKNIEDILKSKDSIRKQRKKMLDFCRKQPE